MDNMNAKVNLQILIIFKMMKEIMELSNIVIQLVLLVMKEKIIYQEIQIV